jgi:hypothetical protein
MDGSARTLFGDTVTCKKFERAPSGLCKHYTEAGYCALPDELVCVELSKQKQARREQARTSKPAVQRNLLGEPVPVVPEKPAPRKPPPAQVTPTPKRSTATQPNTPFGLTQEDVDRFKADGIEVLLESAGGDIWLVPELTGADRQEMTVEHLATVIHVAGILPGARLKGVHRRASAAAEATR